MLEEKEKNGLTKLLETLSDEDLLSLSNTTTKGMVVAESRDEAIKAIIAYTEKPSHLLQRRKMKKVFIFNYLRSENVIVPVNGEKLDYIKTCLKYWKSCDEVKLSDLEDSGNEPSDSKSDSNTPSDLPLTQMGHQFTLWFYQMLNKNEDFGAHHFWPDCSMIMFVLQPNSESTSHHIQGADMVYNFLNTMIKQNNFHFDPNLNGNTGVNCMEDSHGLIKIIVSGIVHKLSNCVGLFDQMFGLVKVPEFSSCWKIKCINLQLKLSTGVQRFGSNQIQYEKMEIV